MSDALEKLIRRRLAHIANDVEEAEHLLERAVKSGEEAHAALAVLIAERSDLLKELT